VNSLIILPGELGAGGLIAITDPERLKYIRELHELEVGREIKIGIFGGQIGRAVVRWLTDIELKLQVIALGPAPKRLPLTILCAIPRPQAVRRLIATANQLGVRRIIFCGSDRSDPSYRGTKELRPDVLQVTSIKALEQACDAVPVEVVKVKRLADALEWELVEGVNSEGHGEALLGDTCAAFINYSHKFYCDGPREEDLATENQRQTPRLYSLVEAIKDIANNHGSNDSDILGAIGPELGWSDRERAQLLKHNFQRLSLGERVLQVDVAAQMLVVAVTAGRQNAYIGL
jgi:16S rRNA (uracil1498-N3)-methyltransferase